MQELIPRFVSPNKLTFLDDSEVPNSHLPVLVYPQILRFPSNADEDQKRILLEGLLTKNSWYVDRSEGIDNYTHYHSTADELLVVHSGFVKVRLGGPSVRRVYELRAGDAAVIPAGVGHQNTYQTDNFKTFGAYPVGQIWDLRRAKPADEEIARRNIPALILPFSDPFFGPKGPLPLSWLSRVKG